jgi:hypothetical protein
MNILLLLAHFGPVISSQLRETQTAGRELVARLTGLGAYLAALREPSLALRVFGLAFLKKALELAAIVAIQAAFGLDPSFAPAVLVLAALAVTTTLPVAPANLGVYEATVFTTYRYLGIDADAALDSMIPSSATWAKTNPSTRTNSAPQASATASASRLAPARICTPSGRGTAARTASPTAVIAATTSGPTPPRRYGRSCMFSTMSASKPAAW